MSNGRGIRLTRARSGQMGAELGSHEQGLFKWARNSAHMSEVCLIRSKRVRSAGARDIELGQFMSDRYSSSRN